MKVKDITAAIEQFAPLSIQEGWDNSGLCIGAPEDEVHGVLVGFDCTPELVDEAVARGCDMVVTHHPLIFRGLKRIQGGEPVADAVIRAVRAGVAVYAAHTTADKVIAGVSGAMARRLGLRDIGMSIQVDPVSGLSIPTDYATEFPKADVILVTHEHGDHFDRVALEALGANAGNLITNARVAEMLGWGAVMANGDTRTLPGGIRLNAVPAYNYSEGRTNFHPKGRDNGFILTIDGLRIYVAGDTEDIPEMADIKDIDVAFLPVNQPYTMTVDQCVHAAEVLQPKVLIPYHFSSTDLSGLPARLPGMTVLLRQMQ